MAKGQSPTARTLNHLRKLGYVAAVVERWNQHARIRQDLFGFIDILAMRGDEDGLLAVQATSGSNVSARVDKIAELYDERPEVKLWLASGNRIEVHGWRKLKGKGRQQWFCRRVEIEFPHGTLIMSEFD